MLSLVALYPELGHTKAVRSPLWTDWLVATPAPTAITAPNWVEIARLVKPAVVNVSIKRQTEPTSLLPGPRDDRDPFNDFFGDQPRRPVRSLRPASRVASSTSP